MADPVTDGAGAGNGAAAGDTRSQLERVRWWGRPPRRPSLPGRVPLAVFGLGR